MQLVLLSAGRGSRLSKSLRNKPKSLTVINKKTILEHNLEFFKKFKSKIIITGYKNKLLNNFAKKNNFIQIYNKNYRHTNMVYSLFLASKHINQDVVVCYGDIIFDPSIHKLLNKKDNLIPLNSSWFNIWKKRMGVKKIKNDAENVFVKKNYLYSIGEKITNVYPKYQYMGLFKLKKKTYIKLNNYFRTLKNNKIDMTNFLNKSIQKKIIRFKIKDFKSFWFEIDTNRDVTITSKELNKIKLTL